jgi:hypothetical protein
VLRQTLAHNESHGRDRVTQPRQEASMFGGLDAQRLVALFCVALLLFNFPLLALWDHNATLWGLPLFPTALFLIWAALIALLAWVMERGQDGHGAAED